MTFAPELFGTSCLTLATLRSANRWICGSLSSPKFAIANFTYPRNVK